MFTLNSSKVSNKIEVQGWYNLVGQINLAKRRYDKFLGNSFGFVVSSNILVRIIQNLSIPLSMPKSLYLNNVTHKLEEANNYFGLNSSHNIGKTTTNLFYGNVLLNSVATKDGPILKFVKHNIKTIDLVNLGNFDFDDEVMYCNLDVVKLLMTYRTWAIKNGKLGKSTTPNNFVFSKVFPDAMESFLNVTILNNFLDIGQEIEEDRTFINIPKELSVRIEKYLTEYKKRFYLEPLSISEYLASIPMYGEKSALDFLVDEDMLFTYDNELAYEMISKIEYYNALLDFSDAKITDGEFVTELKLTIQRLTSSRVFDSYNITDTIKKIIKEKG